MSNIKSLYLFFIFIIIYILCFISTVNSFGTKKKELKVKDIQNEKQSTGKRSLPNQHRIAYLKNNNIWIATIDEKNDVIKKEQITKEGNITIFFGWNYDNSLLVYGTGELQYGDEVRSGPKGYNLWIWDLNEKKKSIIIDDECVSEQIALSPKDNRLVYVKTTTSNSDFENLYLIDLYKKNKPELIAKRVINPIWSHNGDMIAYVTYPLDINDSYRMYNKRQLGIYDLKNKQSISLLGTIGNSKIIEYATPMIIGWNPTDKEIIFTFDISAPLPKNTTGLGAMNINNFNQKILYDPNKYTFSFPTFKLSWLKDNNIVYFAKIDNIQEGLIIANINNLQEQKNIKIFSWQKYYHGEPIVSSDKLRILYTLTHRDNEDNFFVLNIDGNNQKIIDMGKDACWEN